MLTVYRKELKRFFNSIFGGLVLAALLLCNGVAITVYNLAYGTAVLTQTQDVLILAYLILIPALACKALPEERKNGTDVFLYSLPLSNAEIVIGKYLALATVLGIFFLPLIVSPVIFSAFGTVSGGNLWIHWITFLLLCLFLLALCYCISAFFKRPIISWLIGAVALVLIYFLPLLASWTSNHLLAIEPFHLTAGASYGRLDLSAVLLYAGGIALCLLITVCVIAHRRTGLTDGRKKGISKWITKQTVACLLTAAALIAFAFLSPLLPQRIARPALATDEAFVLSQETKNALSNLDGDVTISYLCNGGIHTAQGPLYSFLCDYAESSEHVKLRIIDPAQDSSALSDYEGVTDLENMSVIVQSGLRYRVIDNTELYYYYNSSIGNYRITPEEYSYFCSYLGQVNPSELYAFVASTASYFDGEAVLTNAIRYCLQPSIKILYVFRSAGTVTVDPLLLAQWRLSGYDCRTLTDSSVIPDDCAMLVINNPQKDLTDAEVNTLRTYLDRGGRILLTTASASVVSLTKLRALLAEYGMSVSDEVNIVCEGKAEYCYKASSSSSAAPNLFFSHIDGTSPLTGAFDGTVVVPNAHAIYLAETEGMTHTRWLYTSERGYAAKAETGKNLAEDDARASHTVGALAQKENGGSILWLSSPNLVSSVADSYAYGGNFKLLLSAMNTLSGHTGSALPIPSSALALSMIAVSNGALALWAVILCVVLPLAVLIPCCTVAFLRKRR